jgi:hypothetical protein
MLGEFTGKGGIHGPWFDKPLIEEVLGAAKAKCGGFLSDQETGKITLRVSAHLQAEEQWESATRAVCLDGLTTETLREVQASWEEVMETSQKFPRLGTDNESEGPHEEYCIRLEEMRRKLYGEPTKKLVRRNWIF